MIPICCKMILARRDASNSTGKVMSWKMTSTYVAIDPQSDQPAHPEKNPPKRTNGSICEAIWVMGTTVMRAFKGAYAFAC